MGQIWWGPWPGRRGLWGPGVQPCCAVSGAGDDGSREVTWAAGGSPESYVCTGTLANILRVPAARFWFEVVSELSTPERGPASRSSYEKYGPNNICVFEARTVPALKQTQNQS